MVSTDFSSGARALRPRARILKTLGEELISSETVAVLELVKNSYDADASYVLVRFEHNLVRSEGSLSVEDDGHGMSFQTVETSWMEPATNQKKKNRTSEFLKRRLLGEKGVGRFAAARLAEELELSTRAPLSPYETYAYFDWSQFDNDDIYLDEVLILAEQREPRDLIPERQLPVKTSSNIRELPRDGTHGTLLRMNKLKRTWATRELDELRRGLSRLISPFEADRDFKIFFQLPDQSVGSAQQLEPPEIINYPHYTLSGEINDRGEFKFIVSLHATGEVETFQGWMRRSGMSDQVIESAGPLSERPFGDVEADATQGGGSSAEKIDFSKQSDGAPLCGAFSFQVLVWDRDQLDNIEQKLGTGIRSIRKDLDSVAGISIYRDGFRVLPYGEPENDWLKLDLRRVQNPTMRLSNNQLTGYIKISADSNPLLKDQSNREGLANNQAYSDLQEIMRVALAKLESLRFSEKKKKPATTEPTASPSLLDAPDTSALRKRIAALGSDTEALEILDNTTKIWESQIVRIREVLSRYHTLATLGQLVDKVVHDGRQPLSTIDGQASLAIEAVAKALKSQVLAEACRNLLISLQDRLNRVRGAAGLIDLLLKRIEPLGGRQKGRPSKVYLNEIIQKAFAHFDQDIADAEIKVSLPSTDDLVQVDALELQEVLINLIANSIYWLKQTPRGARFILVQCSRPIAGEVDIIFADSGPGVSKSNRANIFEPYFSTKPDGVGLGLVIAGEIIRDYYDGSLELLNAGPLPGAVFRIKLRKRV
ncbi:ATP-binding protein [Rhodanobacter sp. A1T4]|uniref:sensor histidine kinase n=1 Tax=Rhodanobacter sp. A1T4 TaxID=2723087 RepID=UPI001622AA17|nr:ATP-binding protein [Rhodanobacter sp. A1T4]MBB6247738.1 hypothetical protein [Rhodanobacter sp. A1T4]